MSNWEKIYYKYKQGGGAWATIDGKIIPQFKTFINRTNFKHKRVLDIGCGTGNYLFFLSGKGFNVDGIDSSPTAVALTKELLKNKADRIRVADMFKLRISNNKYDLIISIATIQHGNKQDIQKLINKIYSALIPGGKIFITLPDIESSISWDTFRNKKDLGNGTFIPMSGPERGIPHSFYTKEEIQKLFLQYRNLKLDLDEYGKWIIQAVK